MHRRTLARRIAEVAARAASKKAERELIMQAWSARTGTAAGRARTANQLQIAAVQD